jgi:hypothetical protein
MATQLQFRRGTSAQNNSYTGLVGEITLDTDTNNIRIHDGSTAGGAEIIPAGTIMAYGGAAAPTGGFFVIILQYLVLLMLVFLL